MKPVSFFTFLRPSTLSVLFAILMCACDSSKETTIAQPFKGLTLPTQEQLLDASKEQFVSFYHGISVEVPALAFVNKNGDVVKDRIILQLKPLPTAKEIIASGMPTTFEDDSQRYHLQSASMFEIRAFADGQEIRLRKGKKLTVNHSSTIGGSFRPFYFEGSEKKGFTQGCWKALEQVPTPDTIAAKPAGFGSFQLRFNTEDFAKQKLLNQVQWTAATERHNPLNAEHKWVLQEKWKFADISQPKFAFGQAVWQDSVHSSCCHITETMLIAPDSQTMLLRFDSGSKLLNRKGDVLLEINSTLNGYRQTWPLGPNFFQVMDKDTDYVYDFKGRLHAVLPEPIMNISSDGSTILRWGGAKYHEEPIPIFIHSAKGALINTVYIEYHPHTHNGHYVFKKCLLSANDEILINDGKGVSIYDLKGELKYRWPFASHNFHVLGYGQLLIEGLDEKLTAWKYLDAEETTSSVAFATQRKKIYRKDYYGKVTPIPGTQWVAIQERKKTHSILWNMKTDAIKILDFEVMLDQHWKQAPFLVMGYNQNTSTFSWYDVNKQSVIAKLYHCPEPSKHQVHFSENGRYFTHETEKTCRLYTNTGTLIKDFMAFDSSSYTANFLSDTLVGTLSHTGVFRKWTTDGKQVFSRKLDGSTYVDGKVLKTKVHVQDLANYQSKTFNLNGELLWTDPVLLCFREQGLVLNSVLEYDELAFQRLVPLEENVYELTLENYEKEFTTYVYLSPDEVESIKQYSGAQLKWLNGRETRINSPSYIMRRLVVENMGVYGYCRLTSIKNNIQLPVSFEFDQPADVENVSVFLISDNSGTSVRKIQKSDWNTFSFNPADSNHLLAVFPYNRVAYLPPSDFEKLSIAEGVDSLHFNMKIINQTIHSHYDLTQIW